MNYQESSLKGAPCQPPRSDPGFTCDWGEVWKEKVSVELGRRLKRKLSKSMRVTSAGRPFSPSQVKLKQPDLMVGEGDWSS